MSSTTTNNPDSPRINLGADIGGTFTDVVLEIGETLYSSKVLTTPKAPENAILEGLAIVCEEAKIKPAQINRFIHGTTLATNALIERHGAKTALITTQGFRDVIEMRTEGRFEQYDLNLEIPPPLIPRHQRYTLEERVGANGNVLKPLATSDIEQLANELAKEQYESVAVGFIHSYLNNSHEEMVRDVLARKLPELMISLSSEVSPQMREYERFNTVAANAYVKPMMRSYLLRLVERMGELGVQCPVFLMHSGGGIISLDSASDFPVRLVESGPAGGAIFAAHIAKQHDIENVLSFDMGGTTAKICLIKNQTPKTSRVFEVARTYRFKKGSGMPISIPVIDMVEIGAGGGSLAHVDSLSQIRVGPESAGSDPGPACYNSGGTRPAVTDADLILGKLDPDGFAGGKIKLSVQNAAAALDTEIGKSLGFDTITAANGVIEVVDENMANAARVHAVENGEDLSRYTMIAFGGAAPLHAGRLCQKLGIKRLLVPKGAGVGSAIGFLKAPFSFEATRSVYMRMTDFNADTVRAVFAALEAEALKFVRSCGTTETIESDHRIYMRYIGQGWEIPVSLTSNEVLLANPETFIERFESEYSTLFGRIVHGLDMEITVWAVNSSTPPIAATAVDQSVVSQITANSGRRQVFDPVAGAIREHGLVERETLMTGQCCRGPIIITETETSVIVPDGFEVTLRSDGCLDIVKLDTTERSQS